MKVNWKAVGIDIALVLFIIAGLLILHRHKQALVPVIPASPVVMAPILTPVPLPTPRPIVVPQEHRKRDKVRSRAHSDVDCVKVRSYTHGYSQADVQLYGEQYGLSPTQIRAVRRCLK